ncbi:hypothetical protein N7468_005168 [Penicillium chermesinum]|uniref:Uncharacterized protein n=1 Tax=Penicillium chermesinum TaxID=63820 RepID=A0A9W9P133_9EURO|nr:uncharacterized protein N7468_005168 [Penicillium chermesinum]KAJ5232212.1 hypothetical protein N7468_005168 [Penicillium chermesinum]KAJ6171874.1 hypothetical protein N7470_000941 [Penicillium chermesinum]
MDDPMEKRKQMLDSVQAQSLPVLNWHKLFESDSPPRLGIEVEKRIPYAAMSGFATGFGLGYLHGSKRAGLVFRAENAHRFPTSSQGWFQYHRSKNHVAIVGGVKDGMKMGFKLGAGALAFSLFEETVDYARHDKRDFLSTVTAGLSFSGIYSLLARHDLYTTARNAKFGLKLSLAYGLLQDALETAKGNHPAYLNFFFGH